MELLFEVAHLRFAEGAGTGTLALECTLALLQRDAVLRGDSPPHLLQILASVLAGVHNGGILNDAAKIHFFLVSCFRFSYFFGFMFQVLIVRNHLKLET